MNVQLAVQEEYGFASETWLNVMGTPGSSFCESIKISEFETVETVKFYIKKFELTDDETSIGDFGYKYITGVDIKTIEGTEIAIGEPDGEEVQTLTVEKGDLVGLELVGGVDYIEKISLIE